MDERVQLNISWQNVNASSTSNYHYNSCLIESQDSQSHSDERKSRVCAELSKTWRELKYGQERMITVLLYSLIAAIGSCINGFMLGYSSMTQIDLLVNFPDFFTLNNYAWIASSAAIGALLGGPLAGVLADRLGRKTALILSAIPLTIGWLAISLSVEQFYWPTSGKFLFIFLVVGRIVSGLGAGWLFAVVPIYIVEISPSSLKGFFSSFNQLAVTIGIFLIYLMGAFLSYYIVAQVVLASVVLFAILLLFIPETPYWLVNNEDYLLAVSTLHKLRGPKVNIPYQMDIIQKAVKKECQMTFAQKLLLLRHYNVFIPFMISIFLMFFQQFNGINVVIFYAGNVLNQAGLPSTSAVLAANLGIGIVQVAATFVSVLLIDILGRKKLLISGSVLISFSTGCLGLYFFLINKHPLTPLYILAVICLSMLTIGFSISWGPIPWVMMGELAPMQSRGLLCGIATAVTWIFAVIIITLFDKYWIAVGSSWAWLTFTVCSVLSILFVVLFLPETKGKDLQDIENYYSRHCRYFSIRFSIVRMMNVISSSVATALRYRLHNHHLYM